MLYYQYISLKLLKNILVIHDPVALTSHLHSDFMAIITQKNTEKKMKEVINVASWISEPH